MELMASAERGFLWAGLFGEEQVGLGSAGVAADVCNDRYDELFGGGFRTPEPSGQPVAEQESPPHTSVDERALPAATAADYIAVYKIFGPAPYERGPLQRHSVEPPDQKGHCRLVTHPAGQNIMHNKGAGYDQFEVVSDIDGPPSTSDPNLLERLELVVVDPVGAHPEEKAKVSVGDRFMGCDIRSTPLPIGKNSAEKPVPGLQFWRAPGYPNRFMFVYGEHEKGAYGKMDKAVARSAVWQLRYSVWRLNQHGEKDQEVWHQKVPGLLVLRAESAQNAAKNKIRKDANTAKKRKVISLLQDSGCRKTPSVKLGLGELLTFGTENNVSAGALAKAADLSEDQVGELVRKKRRNRRK